MNPSIYLKNVSNLTHHILCNHFDKKILHDKLSFIVGHVNKFVCNKENEMCAIW